MVVKVYISGISGNKEVKKRQQRVLMILESKNIPCEVVDITEPGKEDDKEFMQKNSKIRDSERHPLPPQLFNDQEYCGDYDDFDLSNEIDKLEEFLKVPRAVGNGAVNGLPGSRETSAERVTETVTTDDSDKTAPRDEPVVEPTEETAVEPADESVEKPTEAESPVEESEENNEEE